MLRDALKKKQIIESFHEQKVGLLEDCHFKSISVMLLLQVLVRDCETEVFCHAFIILIHDSS